MRRLKEFPYTLPDEVPCAKSDRHYWCRPVELLEPGSGGRGVNITRGFVRTIEFCWWCCLLRITWFFASKQIEVEQEEVFDLEWWWDRSYLFPTSKFFAWRDEHVDQFEHNGHVRRTELQYLLWRALCDWQAAEEWNWAEEERLRVRAVSRKWAREWQVERNPSAGSDSSGNE